MSREDEYRRIAGTIFVVVLFIISFLIIRPFIIAILSAAALSYIFYPMYLNFQKRMAIKISALLTCIIIISLVLIPATLVTVVVTYEIKGGYAFLRQQLQPDQINLPSLAPAFGPWAGYLPQAKEIIGDLASQMIAFLQGVIKGIPNVTLNIFVTIFSMYFFLIHGRDLYLFFSGIVPLPEGRYKQILKRFNDLSRGMIMGQLVVGMVQGILAWLGFWYLGVPNAVLWGFLTAIISIIPLLGAVIVWLPVDIYLFIMAMNTGQYFQPVALLIYGMFVISLIDNFLKPKIVGDHANIHPLIVLFGILGGIQLFGIAGILIGPLVLTIFDLVIEIYKEIV